MMPDNLFCPYERPKLWSKNFVLLAFNGFLLYTMAYGLLVIYTLRMSAANGLSYGLSALYTTSFAIGLFLPGVFNSYLIDIFKRKTVCQLSLLLFLLSIYLSLYVTHIGLFVGLRIIQGALFSLVLMSTGSTLVIDVTPSHRRTDANVSYVWVCRFGMVCGLMLGSLLYHKLPYATLLSFLTGTGVLALFATIPLKVRFHAPLETPLFSFDRFLLPRTWRLAGNLFFFAFIIGAVIGHVVNDVFYLLMAVGFIIALLVVRFKLSDASVRSGTEVGFAALLAGLIVLRLSADILSYGIGALLTGIGMGISLSRFFLLFINMAQHCERGTANNTYFLTVEWSILAGFLFENMWTSPPSDSVYTICLLVGAIGIVYYEWITYTHCRI